MFPGHEIERIVTTLFVNERGQIIVNNRFPKLPAAPPATTPSTRASMKGNKSKGSMPEMQLAEELESRGLTQHIANCADLPGTPDFAFLRERVAIFLHGCFWHRCPYCSPNFPKTNQDYWSAKFQRNRYRDAQNRSELRAMGWKPVVVWECILLKDPCKVVDRIQRWLESSRE